LLFDERNHGLITPQRNNAAQSGGATRNSSIEHGSFASTGFPLAVTVEFIA
jgi:hypothetical protein